MAIKGSLKEASLPDVLQLLSMGKKTGCLGLAFHDSFGQIIATNNNWQDTQATEIAATGLAPGNSLESAILAPLVPGDYTAILSDVNGATGIGLVEIYNITPNQ